MTRHLRNDGHRVNEKRIRRLMRLMPIYQKPNTSRPAWGHKTYPYLLRGLRVERPSRVWCSDITSLPMRRGAYGLAYAQSSILADLEHPRMRPRSPPVQEQGRTTSGSRR